MNADWLKRLLHLKTEREIIEEVNREPHVKRAREGLDRVDRILRELQVLEGKR